MDYLRGKLKLKADEELLHSITGILDVNCHEVRSNIPGECVRACVRECVCVREDAEREELDVLAKVRS